jgi:thiol-disulfide isomerase/thioredoxin
VKVASAPGHGPGPEGNARARTWGRFKLSTVLTAVACVLLAVAAVVVLTSGAKPRHGPQAAKPFTLGEVGHPATLVSLSDYAGRPVIINFFGSWCGVCQTETPLLARFYQSHHGTVVIIGIDGRDKTSAALKFLHAKGVTYPVVADPDLELTAEYGAQAGYPQTFFLNGSHQIVRHVLGAVTAGELNAWAATLAHRAGAG